MNLVCQTLVTNYAAKIQWARDQVPAQDTICIFFLLEIVLFKRPKINEHMAHFLFKKIFLQIKQTQRIMDKRSAQVLA